MTYDLLVDYTYGGIHLSRDYLDLTKEELDDYIMWYKQTYNILDMKVYENV
jgi:hypothetical protein